MIKMKKIEIFIKNKGNTWLSFHVIKYWLKVSDNQLLSDLLLHVWTPLCIQVSPYITGRYAKPINCVPQQNAVAGFTEFSLYKYHKRYNI